MKDNKIAVSIIVPTHNLEKYIGDCINSILRQSFKNFELILVDDCSDDNTKGIIKEYIDSELLADIILLENDHNMGAGYSRNRGLSIARGKYLFFLDGDDLIEPNMLERLYSICEKSKADIVIFNYYVFDNDTQESIAKRNNTSLDMFIETEESFQLSDVKDCAFLYLHEIAWDKIFRREFILENEIKFQCQNNANDQFFVYAGLLKAQKIVKISDYLLRYRKNRKNQLSTSDNISRSPFCIWNATKATLDYIGSLGLYDLYKNSFNMYVVRRLASSLKLVDSKKKGELLRFYKEKGFEALKLKDCSMEDFGVPYYFAIYKWLNQLKSSEEFDQVGRWELWHDSDKCEKFFGQLRQEKNIVLWGVGKNGEVFLEMARENKLDIKCVVDVDKNKLGQVVQGYKIMNYDSIANGNLIIVTNPDHILAIKHQMILQNKKISILDVRACFCFDLAFSQSKLDVL